MSLYKKIATSNRENQNKIKLNGITFTKIPKVYKTFSLDDIITFRNTVFNVHELARKQYLITKSEDDAMIAVDAMKIIQDIKKYYK
ncbi:MAG: hypothetical protein ACFFDN_49200 [Candidatus Hodarchaeota archaeon]